MGISVALSFLPALCATSRDEISMNGKRRFSPTALKGILMIFLPVLQSSTVFLFCL